MKLGLRIFGCYLVIFCICFAYPVEWVLDTLHTRYLLEDIPTGLIPMACLGRLAGVDVDRMETVIKLGEFLTGKDFTSSGRSLENLGLAEMTVQEIRDFIETGVRKEAAG